MPPEVKEGHLFHPTKNSGFAVYHQSDDASIVPLLFFLFFSDLLLIGWGTAAFKCAASKAKCSRLARASSYIAWLHSLTLNYRAGLQLKVREWGGSAIQLRYIVLTESDHIPSIRPRFDFARVLCAQQERVPLSWPVNYEMFSFLFFTCALPGAGRWQRHNRGFISIIAYLYSYTDNGDELIHLVDVRQKWEHKHLL